MLRRRKDTQCEGSLPTGEVRAERANGSLLRFQFKVNVERFTEHSQVLGPRKPWRKARGLADPDVAQLNTL